MSRALGLALAALFACSAPTAGGDRTSPVQTSASPRPAASLLTFPRTFGSLALSWPCSTDCDADETLNTTRNEGHYVRFRQRGGTSILYSGEDAFFVSFSTSYTFDVLWVFDRAGYAIRYYIPKAASSLRAGAVSLKRGAAIGMTGERIDLIGASYAIDLLKTVLDPRSGRPDMAATLDSPVIDLHVSDFQR